VAEHDRLTGSPVLVEDLRAIGGSDGAHVVFLSIWCWCMGKYGDQGAPALVLCCQST
jgi:hypothetical protein